MRLFGLLLRGDFGNRKSRVRVARTLGRIPGPAGVAALSRFVKAAPKGAEPAVAEAKKLIEERGGKASQ